MSNRSYSKFSHNRSGKKKREIIATEEMKKLVPTRRIAINEECDTVYVYNGNERAIQGPVGDPITTTSVLKPKIIERFHLREDAVVEWCGLLTDLLQKVLEGDPDLEDEDQEESRKPYYIHKYSKGIPLLEAGIVKDQPDHSSFR